MGRAAPKRQLARQLIAVGGIAEENECIEIGVAEQAPEAD